MSDSCIIHGFIEEVPPNRHPEDREFFHCATAIALASLPERDPWPPFARPMLSTTGPDDLSGSMKQRRLIMVAGHFNQLYDDVAPWLDKFERFLSRVFWFRAELFLHLGVYGSARLTYRVTADAIQTLGTSDPRPPSDWTLRCRDLDGGNCRSEFFVEIAARRRGHTAESR